MKQLTKADQREAGEKCSVEIGRRTQIKLPTNEPPQILICVPIGGKSEEHHFPVPPCKDENCKCKNHGQHVHTPIYNQGLVPAEWAVSIANVVVPLNTTIGYLFEKGRLSADARNRMTQRCLELKAKYVFYWDDDVILHPHMLYAAHNILETNPDIGLVTGVYMTREDPTEPMIYRDHGKGACWDFSTKTEDPPEDIFSCGGGCIMARVEDIAKMKEPYWADEQVVHESGQTMWGHDVRFVRKFAQETGKRVVVKGHLLCGHWDVPKQKMYMFPQLENGNVDKRAVKRCKSNSDKRRNAGSSRRRHGDSSQRKIRKSAKKSA
jgi:hypothetical protein